MLKPYTRQQIQTGKVLSVIGDTYYKDILEQILTHKDTLYNIIPFREHYPLLRNIITNTDSVVILVNRVIEPIILDKGGGCILGTLAEEFVGTELFTVGSDTKYIIETNYKSVHDVYARLPI